MKKGLVASYLQGIRDDTNTSESYLTILRYFWPEFIAALALYSILNLLDARFIADLKSTTMYATLGMTNTLYHFIVKVAEGLSVGAVIMCGQYNGAKQYPQAGLAFVESFWAIVVTGFCVSGFLYLAAPAIYVWYGATGPMIALGVPFLANPDLVSRFKNAYPLNTPDAETFYGGGEKGYTDYPLYRPIAAR